MAGGRTEPAQDAGGGMRAFVLHGREDLRAAVVDRPRPAPDQALIRVRRAGICGSDVHYFSHGRVGRFAPKRPLVLGHEFAGEVVELGAAAEAGLLGRRVAVDPSIPCGRCACCRGGRYNLCLAMRFFGSASCDPHLDGGFAEFVAVPAANCHPLPDGLSCVEAAMVEPLSVALHAAQRAGGVSGRRVLVTGGGAIGLLIAMAAEAFGATTVALSDPARFARDSALAAGATAVLDAADPAFADQAAALSDGGFDVAFEASGAPQALGQALAAARRSSRLARCPTRRLCRSTT